MFTFLFIQLHISPYNVLPEVFVFVCKQGCLQKCKYDWSLLVTETYVPTKVRVDIWLLFELWVLNLNEKEEEKKMKNSAHHSPIHL